MQIGRVRARSRRGPLPRDKRNRTGLGRFFADRERRILGYLFERERTAGAGTEAHLYEIAQATALSEPTALRGLLELVSGGLVQRRAARPSAKASGTLVRPYALTEMGRAICGYID